MGQLASRFVDRERRLAVEAGNAVALQAFERGGKELKKKHQIAGWTSSMYSLLAVQRALEEKLGSTAPGYRISD